MDAERYIIAAIVALVVIFIVRKYLARGDKSANYEWEQIEMIRDHGIPATGKIIAVKQINASDTVRLRLTVEVTKSGEQPYRLTRPNPTSDAFRFLVKDVHLIQVGAELPIHVHPTEPDRIAFDVQLESEVF